MKSLERLLHFTSPASFTLAVAAAFAVLPACTSGDAIPYSTPDGDRGDDETDGGSNTVATEYVASGSVVDTRGRPLKDVEVVVDNQFLSDSYVTGKTGSDGRYRIELPPVAATWHVSATHVVEYHGKTYSFPLHPNDDSAFAGNAGGVRDFQWKLKGKRPDDGFYGAFVVGYTEIGDSSIDVREVELTLVPDGPLVDGSEGETVTGKFVSTGDGDAVQDIPLGRYTITAKTGGAPLMLRLRNGGTSYETSITSDFDAPYGSLPIYNLAVELSRP